MKRTLFTTISFCLSFVLMESIHAQNKIIHDAEYYILEAQNGERWSAEDQDIDKRLADLKKKHGTPPTFGLSPTPLAPIGWCGLGVVV